MLKLDVIPLKEGSWDGWAYINDPKPKDDDTRSMQPQRPQFDGMPDEDPPF
jgi:hypothetical protein